MFLLFALSSSLIRVPTGPLQDKPPVQTLPYFPKASENDEDQAYFIDLDEIEETGIPEEAIQHDEKGRAFIEILEEYSDYDYPISNEYYDYVEPEYYEDVEPEYFYYQDAPNYIDEEFLYDAEPTPRCYRKPTLAGQRVICVPPVYA